MHLRKLHASILVTIVLAIAFLSSVPSANAGQAGNSTQGVTVDAVLTEIQKGLSQAQKIVTEGSLPPLESVTLTLLAEYNVKGGPKFKLLIFSFGKTWERQTSNQLTYVLKPPSAASQQPVGADVGISKQLVDAIVGAAAGVHDAATRQPPLLLNSFSAELGFVVKEVTSGAVKFEIVPVSIEAGVDYSKKAVHTIKVAFAQPKPKS